MTAVGEGSVEPSSRTLSDFLSSLPRPLSYPVAIDSTGRVADGYEVLGVPWFVFISPRGQILYHREVSTAGWPEPQRPDPVRASSVLAASGWRQTGVAGFRRSCVHRGFVEVPIHRLTGAAHGMLARERGRAGMTQLRGRSRRTKVAILLAGLAAFALPSLVWRRAPPGLRHCTVTS